jgi:threonine synthase
MLQEELIQHGIGDTIFTRSRNIEKLLNLNNIYLKFEGGNPTGTMKDRAAYACLRVAREEGFESFAIASCGNFGASFVYISRIFDMVPHVYIPESYHTPRIAEMEKLGGVIHRVPGTYEDAVMYSAREADERGWFNANPGYEPNKSASMEAYATISYEIFQRLGCAPDYVAVPIGNGTTIAGIHRGFRDLLEENRIVNLPILLGGSTTGGNPVVKCLRERSRTIVNLEPKEIVETDHNEPLVSWISLDGQEALDALWESGGWATYVPDEELLRYSDLLAQEEGLLVLPASCASLAAIVQHAKEKKPEKDRKYVAVLTGRRFQQPT